MKKRAIKIVYWQMVSFVCAWIFSGCNNYQAEYGVPMYGAIQSDSLKIQGKVMSEDSLIGLKSMDITVQSQGSGTYSESTNDTGGYFVAFGEYTGNSVKIHVSDPNSDFQDKDSILYPSSEQIINHKAEVNLKLKRK